MFKDYYEILSLSPRASGEDVRSAFKRLALQHHPDRASTTIMETEQARALATEAASAQHAPTYVERDTRAGIPSLSEAALATPSVSHTKDFTDVLEAYEVLGDVARRYLYDMNYQELLMQQEQQRQEERARRDAHLRAVEEAARRAYARDQQQRSLRTQTQNALQLTSLSPPPEARKDATQSSDAKFAATAATVELAMEVMDLCGDGAGGVVYSSTAPSLRPLQHRQKGKARNGDGVARRARRATDGFNTTAGLRSAEMTASTRLSSQRYSPQSRMASSTSSTFLVTNSISLAVESGGGVGGTRAAGGRPTTVADGVAERPMAYYHQQSIERTIRVFFDDRRTS